MPTVNVSEDGTAITSVAEKGAIVNIDTDGDGVPNYTTVADSNNGNYVVDTSTNPLLNGKVVTATATDKAGNISAPATDVASDMTPPDAPIIQIDAEDGHIYIIPTDNEETATQEVTYTPIDGGNEVTVTFTRDPETGDWVDSNPDDGIAIDPKTGVIILPATMVKDATEVTAVAKDAKNNAAENIAELPVPSAPTIIPENDGSVTIEPKGDNVTEQTIIYTDEVTGEIVTIIVEKNDDGSWAAAPDQTYPDGVNAGDNKLPAGITVDPATGTVFIPAENVQDGSTITATEKDSLGTSNPEQSIAGDNISEPDVEAKIDGSVTITPSEGATTTNVTYRDEKGETKEASFTKDADGNWIDNNPDDNVVIDLITGVVIIPADNVADGSTVSANQITPAGQSGEGVADAKDNVPEPNVLADTDGSVTVRPTSEADALDITYIDEKTGEETAINFTKDPTTGEWLDNSPNDDITIDPVTGEVTLPANQVADGTPVKATQTEVRDGAPVTSDVAQDTADSDIPAPVITANPDGSVSIKPADNATDQVIDYIDEEGEPQEVIFTKDPETGEWIDDNPDDKVTIDPTTGEVILPETAVKDGSTVTATQTTPAGNSDPDEATAKDSIPEPVVTGNPNGSVTIQPSDEATEQTVKYTDEDGNQQEVIFVKNPTTGEWEDNNPDDIVTVDPTTGEVTIPAEAVKNGSEVSATQTVPVDGTPVISDKGTDKAPAVDTSAPDQPIITNIVNNDTNNDGVPDSTTITGTTEPNATVEVDTDGDGKPDVTTIADDRGDFEITVVPALEEDQGVPVTATDGAGNTSDPVIVEGIDDDIAPPAPILTVNPEGTKITGSTEPEATIEIDTNGDDIPDYTTIANDKGVFTVDTSDKPLTDGEIVTGKATDEAGNKSEEGTTTAPTITLPITDAPVVNIEDGGDDFINPDDLNEDGTVNVGITFPADSGYQVGDTLTVTGPDNVTQKVVLTEDNINNGITIVVTPIDGQLNEVTAEVTNSTGIRPTKGQDEALTDLSAPDNTSTTLTVADITADNIINAAESSAQIAVTGNVTGDFSKGDEVTLTVNGNEYTGNVDTAGNYSINVAGADLVADSDTTVAASIAATDAAGNVGAATADKLYQTDTSAPDNTSTTLTVADITADNIINAAESSAQIAVTGNVTGDFSKGNEVTLTVNGNEYTGNVDTAGNYSINVAGADLVADSDTMVAASIAATDAAGNVGAATADKLYQTDIVSPTVKISVTDENGNIILSGDDSIDLTLAQGSMQTITFTISEDVADTFQFSDINAPAGTLTDFNRVSATEYTAVFIAESGGLSEIFVTNDKFEDAAGNKNKDGADADNGLQIEVIVPQIDITTIAGEEQNPINIDSNDYAVITALDAVNGFTISGITKATIADGAAVNVTISGNNNDIYAASATVINGTWTLNVLPNSLGQFDSTMSYEVTAATVNNIGETVFDVDTTLPQPIVHVEVASLNEDTYTITGGETYPAVYENENGSIANQLIYTASIENPTDQDMIVNLNMGGNAGWNAETNLNYNQPDYVIQLDDGTQIVPDANGNFSLTISGTTDTNTDGRKEIAFKVIPSDEPLSNQYIGEGLESVIVTAIDSDTVIAATDDTATATGVILDINPIAMANITGDLSLIAGPTSYGRPIYSDGFLAWTGNTTQNGNQFGPAIENSNAPSGLVTTNANDIIYSGYSQDSSQTGFGNISVNRASIKNGAQIETTDNASDRTTVDTAAGDDIVKMYGNQTLYTVLYTGEGIDKVSMAAGQNSSPLFMEAGDDILELGAANGLDGTVYMGSGGDNVTVTGNITGTLDLGSGQDLIADGIAQTNYFDANNTSLYNDGVYDAATDTWSNVNRDAKSDENTVRVTGSVSGDIVGGLGQDLIVVEGYIQNNADIQLKEGDDSITAVGVNNSVTIDMGAGDDSITLTGELGNDTLLQQPTINMGDNNDTFTINFDYDSGSTGLSGYINGGTGIEDTFALNGTNTVELGAGSYLNQTDGIEGFEYFDMTNSQTQTVIVSASDVLESNVANNTIFIAGGSEDTVDLDNGFSSNALLTASHTAKDGIAHNYTGYENNTTGEIVYIDNNIIEAGNII